MVGITGQAVSDYFGVDLGATLFGGFVLFQHKDTGTFTENETIPVLVEGTKR